MTRKIISAGILLMLLVFNGCTVLASGDTGGNRDNGQIEITYIPDQRPQVFKIDRGEGVHGTPVKTGDPGVMAGMEILVISSAVLLVLIIYYKEKEKGETDYEEN